MSSSIRDKLSAWKHAAQSHIFKARGLSAIGGFGKQKQSSAVLAAPQVSLVTQGSDTCVGPSDSSLLLLHSNRLSPVLSGKQLFLSQRAH